MATDLLWKAIELLRLQIPNDPFLSPAQSKEHQLFMALTSALAAYQIKIPVLEHYLNPKIEWKNLEKSLAIRMKSRTSAALEMD